MKTNPMAKIYKSRIESGIMTLEEVSDRWREATRKPLEEDKKENTEEET